MNCSNCGAELNAGAKYCPSCGTPLGNPAESVSTGGGAYVGGNATAGGDFIGRDQVVHGDQTRTGEVGLQGEALRAFTEAFSDVYRAIDSYSAKDSDADAGLLKNTAATIEKEVVKGDDADPDLVRKALKVLAKLAPDVVEIAINALTNPAAAVVSAIRIVAEQVRDLVR